MALQIWLPLTGDTKNRGVWNSASEFQISNGTFITVDNSGKLGKCYAFNSTATNTGIYHADGNYMADHINNKSFSICAWIQTTATDTCVISLSYGVRIYVGDSSHTYITLYNTSRTVGCGASLATNDGKWHHVCGIYNVDTNKIQFYVDGIKKNEVSYTSGYTYASSWNNGLFIGRDPNNSTVNDHYHYKGKMNDVRVYDHALSPVEVAEIAKGLCVHYKLDTPLAISNLARNVSYSVYNNYASAGFTATIANTGRTYNSCKIYRLTYTPGSDTTKLNNVKSSLANHGIMVFSRKFLANTKYCFWILCKPISHPDTIVGGTASNISGWTEIPMKKYSDDWYIVGQCRKGNVTADKTDSIFTSFKTPSAEAGVPITIDFCCPHLLEGYDNILPEYDYIGTDPGIVDSSGYSNHGTGNGSLAVSTSTPRYSYSTKFVSGSHINVSLVTSGFANSYTFSWWGKYSYYSGHMMWGFSNGNRLNLYMSGGNFYWNTGDGNSNPFNISAATYGDDQWHHFAVTGDGTTAKLYIDGDFKANAKTYKGITGTTIYLNGWDSGASYNFNGQLSDFRLYATALSADDIKRLYEVSASVSKNNSMLGYEMKEG